MLIPMAKSMFLFSLIVKHRRISDFVTGGSRVLSEGGGLALVVRSISSLSLVFAKSADCAPIRG
jgi:hypothetical protein